MAPGCWQEVAEGWEEGVTGRELDRWWEGPGGWRRDPVEVLGEVQLRALVGHFCRSSDPAAGDSDTDYITRLLGKISPDKEPARCDRQPPCALFHVPAGPSV